MTRAVVLAMLVSLVGIALPAEAGAPLDTVQWAVASALEILTSPALRDDHAARRAQLRDVAEGLFDFREMSRRALGRHWATRSEAERARFQALFTDLLERCYMRTIENYSGERVVFLGDTIEGDYASVRSKIVTARRAEISVDYRLYRSAAGWSVYDVALENVSLVANYRHQFDRVIRTTSFATLMKRLQAGELPPVTIPRGAGRPD